MLVFLRGPFCVGGNMAGITLEQAEEKLTAYLTALDRVLTNQSYSIAGRSYTRADIEAIEDGIQIWDRQVKRLSRGGLYVKRVIPE